MHVSGHDLFQALVKVSSLSAQTQGRPGTSQLLTPAEPNKAAAESPPPTEDRVAALRYQKSEKTMLRLRTQEGDIVRIKISNRTSAKVTGGSGEGDEGFEDLELSLKSSSKLRVKVQGHLNADEMAAIQDAIGQASGIADYFFANDIDGAFAAAEGFNLDTEQLSGMKLRLRMRESALYAPTRTPLPESGPVGPADDAPASEAAAAGDAPVVGTMSPSVAAANALATTPTPAEVDALADASAPPAAEDAAASDGAGATAEGGTTDSGASSMADALRAISDFLSHVVDVMGNGTGGPADQLSISLKIRIVRSTVEALTDFREAGQISEPVLAGDMLEALAAEYDPPLEEVA